MNDTKDEIKRYTDDQLKLFCKRLNVTVPFDCDDDSESLHRFMLCVIDVYMISDEVFGLCMGEIIKGVDHSYFDIIILNHHAHIQSICDALAPARINYDSATGQRLMPHQSAHKIVSELLSLRQENSVLRQRLTTISRHGDK